MGGRTKENDQTYMPRTYRVSGAPGYTIRPVIARITYPEDGNVHKKTITFHYKLYLDGIWVAWFTREHEARAAARRNDYQAMVNF
jgi:hypothetical protein